MGIVSGCTGDPRRTMASTASCPRRASSRRLGDHMTDDGMMQPDEKVDPMTLLLSKLEAMEKRIEQLTEDNTQIKTQNAQLMRTNVSLMQQAPAPAEPVPDVRDIAFESLKKELMRGRQ